MDYDILPGVFDILPEDKKDGWRSSSHWQKLEDLIRVTCTSFGFEEIRTPIFERTELFLRSSGETTDIVSKELYRFVDKGERDVSLRPEGTAPALRLFKDQDQEWQKHHRKLFYLGPMFRYDRPQAGRYRQFHQFGVEVLGSPEPETDVEVIDLLFTLFSRIGLKGLKLELNSLGTLASRENYLKGLVEYYTPFLKRLSLDSVRRLETNPLRILDSKDPHDKEINLGAPSILEYLDDESKSHFEKVKEWLTKLKIPYVIHPNLVRGLDYYNQTVFEVITDQLGSQNSVGGGGRFDNLLKMLGGPDLPGFGFAAGLERLIQTILKQQIFFLPPHGPELVVIPLGEKSVEVGYQLVRTLRLDNMTSTIDFSKKKLSKRLQEAHDIGAKRVLILGDEECEKGQAKIKMMESGKELLLPLSEIPSYLSLETKLPSLLQESNRLSEVIKTKSVQDPSSELDTIHQNLKNLSAQSMDTNA